MKAIFILLFLFISVISVFAQNINMPVAGSQTHIISSSVTLYDNGGSNNYANKCSGYVILRPALPGAKISISGTITVEGGYDYLTIYEGEGTSGGVLLGGRAHG